MKKLILILGILFSVLIQGYGYQLLGHEKLAYYDVSTIRDTWKKIHIPDLYLPVNNGVHVYEISYITSWIDGSPVKASGIVMIPDNIHPDYSTIIYHNGTNIMKKREQELGYNQFSICAGLAADGYLVVVPDYIGRGNGERHQLYLDAQTESQNSVDFLLSVDVFLKENGYDTIADLFITGYSQGGHAAMSTHRLIEKSYMGKFNLIASSPMSGPYDLETSVTLDTKPVDNDWVLFMYMIKSFQDAYHLRESLSEIFIHPWDSLVGVYFDGINTYREIRTKNVPQKLEEIMFKDFLVKEFGTEDSPLRKCLHLNTVYQFIPTVPTQLCYCSDDEVVPAQNTLTAYNWMKKNGAHNLKIRNAGKNLDHEGCAIFTVIYMKLFFDKYRDIKKSNFRNDLSNAGLSIATAARKMFPKIKLF